MTATPPPRYSAMEANGDSNKSRNDPDAINVLILGETANGKSTLVKQLGIYSGNPNPRVKIGYGNESCTKHVGSHPTSTNLRTYRLDDPSGRPIKDADYFDLMDLTEEDALLMASEPEDDGKVYSFDLIDTPGLDDSAGDDMAIMADIIGRVGHLSHLNAIIYVRSMDQHFGKSFNQFYNYLERCMPMLCRGLIIVHSRFTTDRVGEARLKGVDLARDRHEAFVKATQGRNNGAHFFMDNEPDIYSPFSMMQSFNSCYHLLKLLSKQLPLTISNVKLIKAPNMTTLDTKVLLALTRFQAEISKILQDKMEAASRASNQLFKGKRELSRLESKLSDHQEDLRRLDKPNEIILGSKTVAEEFTLETLLVDAKLWLDKRHVSFDSDCIISKVQKSAGQNCKWLDEDCRGTTWRATLKSSLIRSMYGSATFYTTSQLKNRGEIRMLRDRIKDMQDSISYQTDSLAELDETEKLGADVEKLRTDAERVARTIETIQRDSFDAGLWPVLGKYYLAKNSMPSTTDVVDFVKVYDPDTAMMMSLNGS
ncbi:hypothetical protein F66182_6168 [Fusarium sp. NRRL 66182]|nr:hypothetical protein F66182_6168 [Fusarium sp. NRRL 66182]